MKLTLPFTALFGVVLSVFSASAFAQMETGDGPLIILVAPAATARQLGLGGGASLIPTGGGVPNSIIGGGNAPLISIGGSAGIVGGGSAPVVTGGQGTIGQRCGRFFCRRNEQCISVRRRLTCVRRRPVLIG